MEIASKARKDSGEEGGKFCGSPIFGAMWGVEVEKVHVRETMVLEFGGGERN